MSLREFFAQILIVKSMVILVYNDGSLILLFHIDRYSVLGSLWS